MSTPTPDDIRAAAAETAVDGVQSVTTDGQTTVAMNPLVQNQAANALEARELLAQANPQGGARSAWGLLRPAQSTLPGAS